MNPRPFFATRLTRFGPLVGDSRNIRSRSNASVQRLSSSLSSGGRSTQSTPSAPALAASPRALNSVRVFCMRLMNEVFLLKFDAQVIAHAHHVLVAAAG